MNIMKERQLGQLIDTLQGRDAIHVPIIPVSCDKEEVIPGSTLRYIGDNKVERTNMTGHGVADPFLRQVVPKGRQFWMFLYPGSISDLRHVWTHEDFHHADMKDAQSVLNAYTHETGGD